MLKGIDINPFKADLNLANIHFDFMLEKATGGNAYVNPDCDNKVQQAISLGKLWGVFHYFGDGYNDNDPISEADWFVDNCLGYVGKGIFALDWERGGNPNVGNVSMALIWLNHVYERTGVKSLIYMSMSVYQSLDWSPVINAGYGLWVAGWPENNNVVANYGMDPNLDPNPKWDGVVGDVIWQFTSTGRIDGYGGNLDCDFFYGDSNTWGAYARIDPNSSHAPTTTTTTTAAPVPEPTTTASPTTTDTTTQAPAPTEPDPSTTTTTTELPQPGPSSTTTTTTEASPVTTTAPPQSVIDKEITLLKAVLYRAFNTFWQTFVATFSVGALGVASNLLSVHNLANSQTAIISLVISSVAAALSAIKNTIKPPSEVTK